MEIMFALLSKWPLVRQIRQRKDGTGLESRNASRRFPIAPYTAVPTLDGRNGYLARPGDVDDLVAKIGLALNARASWPAWGEASVQIVRTTFDWPVVARQTLELYQQLSKSAQ